MLRNAVMTAAAALAICTTLVLAQDAPPAGVSRFAAACDLAARQTLVSTMTFSLVSIEDYTRDGEPDVEIVYNAVSTNTGRVYPSVFSCGFAGLDDPANIVLEFAAEKGRPYGVAAVATLNRMLKEAGFQK